MHSRKSINIIGWSLALLSTLCYILTMYPTISFWDSGEYVTSASTLQVGHAPGAPFYQILGAFLAIFGFNSPVWICRLVSLISPLAMGLSVMVLFWILVRMLNRFSATPQSNIISSAVGALCFAFADSVWFSATEAEVYALSVLLSLIAFWLVLKWDSTSKKRYLLLAVYVLGLSCAVHQLSLLVLPAAIVIVYFHQRRTVYKGLVLYLLIGAAVLALLLWLSFSGVLQYFSLFPSPAIGLLVYLLAAAVGLFFARKKKKAWVEFSILGLTFFFIGLSTYCIVPIRSSADVPLNTQRPDTTERLLDYTNRKNYTKAPMIYGHYYTALPPESFKQTSQSIEPVFAKEQKTFFPRMWNYDSEASENGYIEWTGLPEEIVIINGEERPKPSFSQNLRFFFSYQLNYMYFRYLLWNFSGRTNDVQGYGESKNSQWSVGVNAADRFLGIENRELNPQASKAFNRYFAIPLLLCLFGIFYQVFRDTKHFTVNSVLFFYNSIALVLFLNMSAYQPRERDYVYLLSFAAMAIWLSVGVLGISQTLADWFKLRKPKYVVWVFLLVPALMGWQNFDDHNHSDQYTARNLAISMLESCEKNAILFTGGDNDTFPLWYVQHVEKIRQDVRVVNLQLLNSTSQIESLQMAQYTSPALKTNLACPQYDSLLLTQIYPAFDTVELNGAIKSLPLTPVEEFAGLRMRHLNTNRFYLKKDRDTIAWRYDKLDLTRGNLAALDLIAKNIDSRPIYFSSYSVEDFLGLESYLQLEGLAYRLGSTKQKHEGVLPLKAGSVNVERCYENFTRRFCWQGFEKEGVYYNETEREMALQFVRTGIHLAYALIDKGEKEKALTVCEIISSKMPTKTHYYPQEAADVAILYSLLGNNAKASRFTDYAMGEFTAQTKLYLSLSPKAQAEQRPEMFRLINQWLRLLVQAEEMNLEEIRIRFAESYFPLINSYLAASFVRLEKMMEQFELYSEEINKQILQIEQIYSLSQIYEEPLPPLPDFLL